jgi:membrane associated rhomboid family serine protease
VVPIRDDIPTRSVAWVTYVLIALNIIVYIFEFGMERTLGEEQLSSFLKIWGLVPANLTASFMGKSTMLPFPAWVTLFSSQFLHGNWPHVGFNMLFLWVFGNNVEDALGKIKYIIFYLGCGVLAALSQWVFSINSSIPMVGASGAIAGVLGAYILRFPRAKILTMVPLGFVIAPFEIPAVFFLGFWFLQQVLSGLFSLSDGPQMGGVAYWAHAGGFFFGPMLGALLGLYKRQHYR